MAKFIFIIEEEDNREASKIEFEVPNDMDVWEYKRICMRMASAMGYTNLSIKKDKEPGRNERVMLQGPNGEMEFVKSKKIDSYLTKGWQLI